MRQALVLPALVGLLLVAAGAGLTIGASGFRADAVGALLAGDEVMVHLRAPRILMSLVTGAELALAGVAMQAVLRNDLADPYVLGVAGGASAAAVLSLALWPGVPPGPAAALGGAGATTVVRGLSGGGEPTRLVLGGVAVGSLLASFTGLVLVLAPAENLLRSATSWLFGGLGTPTAAAVLVPAVVLLAGSAWLWLRAERLDRLTLGDDVAASLGVPTARLRRTALAVAVLLTASAVAMAGLVGFVGLVAPHAARRMVGPGHRQVVPVAALLGAIIVMLSDTLARSAFTPREVPVGLLTAAVGGPFFLWLLARRPSWVS